MIKIQNLNALYLALAPILSVYKFSNGILLYFVLILLLAILNLFTGNLIYAVRQRSNEVQWYVSIFVIGFIGLVFNSETSYFNKSLFVNNFISVTLFFCALIFCTAKYNVTLLKKTLIFCGMAAAVICIGQRIQLLITGSFYKDFFIPGLEVKRDLETFSTNRVSAFFTEPAHLSIYLLPIFYMTLQEGKMLTAVIIALGILFSGSTTGLLLVALLSICYIAKNTKRKIYILYIIASVSLLYLGIMYMFPDVVVDNLEKLNSVDSGGVRLLGPLQYLGLYDSGQWCFGIGLNQLSDFLSSKGISVVNEWGIEKNANYANAVIYMLLCYGLFGLCFFIRYLIFTMKTKHSDIGFIIYALGILLSDQVLFNMNLLYVLTFMIISQTLINDYNENSISDSSIIL